MVDDLTRINYDQCIRVVSFCNHSSLTESSIVHTVTGRSHVWSLRIFLSCAKSWTDNALIGKVFLHDSVQCEGVVSELSPI